MIDVTQHASSEIDEATITPVKNSPASPNRSGVYRYGFLVVWILACIATLLDRFFWNLWPRQAICDGCGEDFFCEMDEVWKDRERCPIFFSSTGKIVIPPSLVVRMVRYKVGL